MDRPGCSKKVGGSKILHSQSREIVANVYKFMKKEADLGVQTEFKKVQERVSKATGVSIASIRRIIYEDKKIDEEGGKFNTPNRNKNKPKPKSNVDDFDLCVIRRTVNEYHQNHGERPTIKKILSALRQSINFSGGKWALCQILKKLKFKWRKAANNRKVLVEKTEIREHRLNYLRAIKQYRDKKRPIIYIDETYVHSSHSTPKAWSDNSTAGLKVPVSKGRRLIIVHAGSEEGFVKNALITFESGKKSGDYHDDMNYTNYEKWLTEKLVPNLPQNSVVVMDNAAYHNVQVNPAPNSNWRKDDMKAWLSERGIPFDSNLFKPELYAIIKKHKPTYKMFKVDGILTRNGHSVLRLPPYHPDLNPIEMVWGLLKRKVGERNINFSMESVKKDVEQICSNEITSEEWRKRVDHCKNIEKAYLELEPAIDVATEQIIVNLNEDSSDSDYSEISSGSDIDIDNPSDIQVDCDMSGIERIVPISDY